MAPRKKAPPKPISLNPEQTLAVNAGSGVWALIAGAGSGKTSVLVARYQRLLSEGVPPDQILGLTFTSNAAKNMRDRANVQKMDGRVNGFVTFHSLCLSICLAERDNFGFKLAEFPLATEAQTNKITSDIAKKYELNFKQFRGWVGLQKRSGVRPAEALKTAETEGKNEKQALAYKAFDLRLREAMVLDFDSMLLEVITLLQKDEEIRKRWSFGQIMVDEAQDMSPQDYKLVRLLSQSSDSVFFVGDAGQGIFGFRGSESSLFTEIPGVQKMYMGKNHRSDGKIVEFLKEIAPIPELGELFHTDNELGVSPTITGFPSAVDEAKAIVRYVQTNPKVNVAVLSRTNRGLRSVEDQLSVEGIKYRLLNNSGFWTQPEVKAICSYMAAIVFPSDYALGNILRSSFQPTKYLKRKDLQDAIKNKAEDQSAWSAVAKHKSSDPQLSNFISFIHGLQRYRDQKPYTALNSLLQSLHAFDSVEEDAIDNSPMENIQELLKISNRFSTVKDFNSFVLKASAAAKSRSGVTLSTCHSAKGMEWPTVFLINVSDGVFPHSRAEDLQGEANCFFVGCSRAEKELYISYTGIPSPFLSKFLKKSEEDLNEVFA